MNLGKAGKRLKDRGIDTHRWPPTLCTSHAAAL